MAATARAFAGRLLPAVANRKQLLLLEVREERARLLMVIVLTVGLAICGLLCAMALTATVAVLAWHLSPAGVLLGLTAAWAGGVAFLYRRLAGIVRDWQAFPATREQLRRDAEHLKNLVS